MGVGGVLVRGGQREKLGKCNRITIFKKVWNMFLISLFNK